MSRLFFNHLNSFNKKSKIKNLFCYSVNYRWSSNSNSPARNYGVCLDIDGVLIKGKNVIPETREALRILKGENKLKKIIPFILLTNGGGVTERKRAIELSDMFGVPISEEQIVLAHSPMRSLTSTFMNSNVLVIGGYKYSCREVAESYGFNKVILPNDVIAWDPSICPFSQLEDQDYKYIKKIDLSKEPIEAIMVFHDSRDWGRDIQIMVDVLRSKNGYIGTLCTKDELILKQIPLFFSNPDIIWTNNFTLPRFAQGAFRKNFEVLFKCLTGHDPKYISFGKPETITYKYAEKLLENYAYKSTGSRLTNHDDVVRKESERRRVYDNPDSGANDYNWISILVKTGVYQGIDNHAINPAKHIADNVLEAVKWLFNQEENL
nr:8977_t:CDS:10 [Entrophospora candida]